MYGYIYKTTNLKNGKIYVGKHKAKEFDPEYFGSGIVLRQSIEKNGLENFKNELIESCDSKEILNEREKFWIDKFNSRNIEVGYNIAPGGDGGIVWREGEHPSLGKGLKGEKNPFYGKHHSEETKNKVREVWKQKKENGYIQPCSGKRRMRKDGVIKYVLPDEIEKYKKLGWDESKPFRKPTGNRNKGKKWVNHNEEEIMVPKEEFQSYLEKGYNPGRLSSTKNKIKENHYIFSEEDIKQRNEKIKETISNWSDEKKESVRINKRNSHLGKKRSEESKLKTSITIKKTLENKRRMKDEREY